MGRDREIEERIDRHISGWKAPFEYDSESRAKSAVMQRISDNAGGESRTYIGERKPNSYTWLKVAAAVALIFTAGIAYFLTGNKDIKNVSESFTAINLPDGSTVLFTPGSTISYNSRLWRWNRTVKFSGEGYFNVKSGSAFTVNTQVGNVEVLGTAFTLWADNKDMFAHCTEGSVRVRNAGGEMTIVSGEFIDIQDGDMAAVMLFNTQGFISPRPERFLSFESVPVAIVLNELERSLRLKIKNELPSNLVYSGILDISDENQCFQVFCKPFGAIVDKNADGHVSIHLK
ncbi:FecR domain-containing protein [Cryomorpha ignava]|uniref:FecR domain-containing protein n=1 Tax=Cryomorpha ignava TaxID=101383 RepID=A0A7K3WSX7_9FLAO|nr:FecR domain-containing protein [Cryomorpha ignava]NEN24799.1 FecR domain-containing protein [Cryomorpha ignava]